MYNIFYQLLLLLYTSYFNYALYFMCFCYYSFIILWNTTEPLSSIFSIKIVGKEEMHMSPKVTLKSWTSEKIQPILVDDRRLTELIFYTTI